MDKLHEDWFKKFHDNHQQHLDVIHQHQVYQPSWHPSLISKHPCWSFFFHAGLGANLRLPDGAMVCKSMPYDVGIGINTSKQHTSFLSFFSMFNQQKGTIKQNTNSTRAPIKDYMFHDSTMWSSATMSQNTSTCATTEQFSANPGTISSTGWRLILPLEFPNPSTTSRYVPLKIIYQGVDLYSNVTMKLLMTQKPLNAATNLPAKSRTRSPFLEVAQRSSEMQFRNIIFRIIINNEFYILQSMNQVSGTA